MRNIFFRLYQSMLLRIITPILLAVGLAAFIMGDEAKDIIYNATKQKSIAELALMHEVVYNTSKNELKNQNINLNSLMEELNTSLSGMAENTEYAIYFIDDAGHYRQFSKNGYPDVANLAKNRKLDDFGAVGNVFYMSESLEHINAKLLTIKIEPLFYEKIGQREQYIYGAAIIMAIFVLIISVITFYVAVRFPLKKIFAHLDMIGVGYLEPLKINSSREFNMLVTHINKMSNRLKEKLDETLRLINAVEEERLYTKLLLDSQTSIVLVSDGKHLMDANKRFFDYFYEYPTIWDFKTKHECVCDFFEDYESEGKRYFLKNELGWVKSSSQEAGRALVTIGGKKVHFEINAQEITHKTGIISYVVTMDDITEVIMQKEELKNRYFTDTLTGIPNRNKLAQDIQTCEYPSLVIMNIDRFGEINDLYGFSIGDNVIKKFASKTRRMLDLFFAHKKNKDKILKYGFYRLGADEFAVLFDFAGQKAIKEYLTNFADNSNIVAEKTKFIIDDIYIEIKITIGISSPQKTISYKNDPTSIVADASIALKNAKKDMKPYQVFNESLDTRNEYSKNIEISKKLKQALQTGNIIANYQPIQDINTRAIEKYELLLRLIDENGSIISPAFFLEIAKKGRQYEALTRIAIKNAFEAAKKTGMNFSVNLSYEDISNKSLANFLFETLSESKVGEKITFEILESESIKDYNKLQGFIGELKQFGCKVAADDFGAGYSNFEHLIYLDLDYIKIDGSIIKNILVNDSSKIITETIVEFAKKLNIKTVAEYVSSEEIYNAVKAIGVDYAQGYYVGKPLIL